VRYEERGQGYRDVEKVGKHCSSVFCLSLRILGYRSDPLDQSRYSVQSLQIRG